MSMMGMSSLIGYFNAQALHLSPSSSCVSSRSPLHFGQTRISKSSLSIPMANLPLIIWFSGWYIFYLLFYGTKHFINGHLVHTILSSQGAGFFPTKTTRENFINHFVIYTIGSISNRISRAKDGNCRDVFCRAKVKRT